MLIPYGKHYIDRNDIISVYKALKNPFITQGTFIRKFEKAICKLLKVKYCVAVNSCTAGLQLAIQTIKAPNMKVITSPVSFISTSNSILFNKAKPVFADIDLDTLNLKIDKIKKMIKKDKKIKRYPCSLRWSGI